MTSDRPSDVRLATLPDRRYYTIQLWLGDHLIEEHIAPTELAQEYANVIQLRIAGLPGHRLRCIPAGDHARPASPPPPYRRDWHPTSGAE
ncbi:hypothetical protein [Kribbella caucasensis]|uniref:hypothetical protein n=1 Tax=Kribbella caucasensis TaxID=2512215 RepID=UPI00105F1C6A|nr:hypothetical protein [Kribbella sp. VKM Ac-2527]